MRGQIDVGSRISAMQATQWFSDVVGYSHGPPELPQLRNSDFRRSRIEAKCRSRRMVVRANSEAEP